MRHDVIEAIHTWRSYCLELEFSIPENKEQAHFSELSYIFQENLAVDWKPISEDYFCDILSAWTSPISRAALNSRIMSRLPSSARSHLHSLKEFRIAAARDLKDMDLDPLKSSPNLGSLSIYVKIDHDSGWLTHVGGGPNLQCLKHLGGSASIFSQLLPLCPNVVSLTFEDPGWSDVRKSLSPAMTRNICETDLGPILDAGSTTSTELAKYFPKLRRLTAFRLNKKVFPPWGGHRPLLPVSRLSWYMSQYLKAGL
ncbi:MAG TPA: hypothetical protein VGO47_03550 [Chlamydiales bacterium]|nr:hypothetical protein [Chlamydiales bacterium]